MEKRSISAYKLPTSLKHPPDYLKGGSHILLKSSPLGLDPVSPGRGQLIGPLIESTKALRPLIAGLWREPVELQLAAIKRPFHFNRCNLGVFCRISTSTIPWKSSPAGFPIAGGVMIWEGQLAVYISINVNWRNWDCGKATSLEHNSQGLLSHGELLRIKWSVNENTTWTVVLRWCDPEKFGGTGQTFRKVLWWCPPARNQLQPLHKVWFHQGRITKRSRQLASDYHPGTCTWRVSGTIVSFLAGCLC